MPNHLLLHGIRQRQFQITVGSPLPANRAISVQESDLVKMHKTGAVGQRKPQAILAAHLLLHSHSNDLTPPSHSTARCDPLASIESALTDNAKLHAKQRLRLMMGNTRRQAGFCRAFGRCGARHTDELAAHRVRHSQQITRNRWRESI